MTVPTNETSNPTKFDAAAQDRFISLLKLGHGRTRAAEAVGIHPETMRRFARGNPTFKQRIMDAERTIVDEAEQKIIEAMREGEPWAISKILERLDRNKWGDKKQLDVNVSGEIDHTHIAKLPVGEQVEEIERLMAERREALDMGAIEAEVIDDDRG
jgi:hypothetical protein